MANEDHRYPVEKSERRRRVRSRPNYSDRRRHPRYLSNFPVSIYASDGEDKRVYHAIARDISEGGLLLMDVDIPETESSIQIEFKVPDGTMPEHYLHGTFRLEVEVLRTDPQKHQATVVFKETLSQRLARTAWYYLRLAATSGLFLTISLIMVIKYKNLYYYWFDVPVFTYSLAVGFYLITRFLFASLYRPPPPLRGLAHGDRHRPRLERGGTYRTDAGSDHGDRLPGGQAPGDRRQ